MPERIQNGIMAAVMTLKSYSRVMKAILLSLLLTRFRLSEQSLLQAIRRVTGIRLLTRIQRSQVIPIMFIPTLKTLSTQLR